jgi:predicted deacetylase/branched-subunit amino acid transport protein AzlD
MKRGILRCPSFLAAILLVGSILGTACTRQAAEDKQVNVVFRFDDYSALSSTEIELKIIEAFRKKKAAITFGVIPFVCAGSVYDPSPQEVVPLSALKGDILKTAVEDGTVDIALHGYSHQVINAQTMSEFSGVDYKIQVEKLAKGRKLLEEMIGVPVNIFVPPWNGYDLNTLRALEALHFSTISASLQGKVTKNSRLNYLPATCDLSQLRDALRAAQSSADTQPVIVVLFHAYDFREVDEKQGTITYQEFSALLDGLQSRGNVRLLSISQATKVLDDLSVNRFRLNNSFRAALNLLPASLRKGEDNRYADTVKGLWSGVGVIYLTIATLAAMASFLLGGVVFPRSPLVMKIATYGSTAIAIILLIYTFRDLDVYIKGMTVNAMVVGASVGTWLCFLKLKKKSFQRKTGKGG